MEEFHDALEEFYQSVDPSIFEGSYPTSDRSDADIAWVSANRDKLSQYEGKWIAVYNKEIVASGQNGADVQKQALKKLNRVVPDLYLRFLESSNCIY